MSQPILKRAALLLALAAGPLQGAENSPQMRVATPAPLKVSYTAVGHYPVPWGPARIRTSGCLCKQDYVQVTQDIIASTAALAEAPTGDRGDDFLRLAPDDHGGFADLDMTLTAPVGVTAAAPAGPAAFGDLELAATPAPTFGGSGWSAMDHSGPAPIEAAAEDGGTMLGAADAASLAAALAAAGDGDTIRLAPGQYGALKLSGYDRAVTVIAEDGAAVFDELALNEVSGLTLDGLTFQLTFEAGMNTSTRRFDVRDSRDVAIRDSRFLGDDAFGTDSPADGYGAGVGLRVRDSSGVVLDGLEVAGFWKGVMIGRSSDVVLRDSDLHGMRSDAMSLGKVSNVLIENNHLHDRRGAPGSADHGDMIQMMSRDADTISENVILRGNLIDVGSGDRAQSLFLSNRAVANGADDDMFYRNFLIEDNVIIGAQVNALVVGAIDGLVIRNNTVLHAEPASGQSSSVPRISVMPESRNVTISDNVTTGLTGYRDQADWTVGGNWIVQNTDPGAPDHYSQHFLAPDGQLGGHVEKLWVKPDSPIYTSGAGAAQMRLDQHGAAFTPLIQNTVQANQAAFAFDAEASVLPGEEEDAQYLWDFGDGTIAAGLTADHVYAGPGRYTVSLTIRLPDGTAGTTTTEVGVSGADLVGLLPHSDTLAAFGYGDVRVIGEEAGAGALLNESGLESDGDGLDLEALDGPIRIPRDTFLPLFDGAGFEIALQLSVNGGGSPEGEILRLHGALKLEVSGAGEIVAAATIAGGDAVKLVSSGARISDGAVHDVRFALEDGRLYLQVDGLLQDDAAFAGMLAEGGSRDMTLGGAFGRTAFPGTLESFVLRSDPDRFVYREAGVDLPGGPDDLTVIVGSETDDVLRAGPEDTLLEGRGGNDRLCEGPGDDVMTGGAGADRFVFDLRKDDGPEIDRITDLDFAAGDWIQVLTAEAGLFDELRGSADGLRVSDDGSSLQIRTLDALVQAGSFAPAAQTDEAYDGLALASLAGDPSRLQTGSPKAQLQTGSYHAPEDQAAAFYDLAFPTLSGDLMLISLAETGAFDL